MRLMSVCLLFVFVLAACEIDSDSARDNPPTPVVITSTPTEGDPDSAQATTTPGEEPTATVGDAADATASPTEAADGDATSTEQPEQPGDDTESAAIAEIEQIESNVVELRELELIDDLNEEIIDRAELESRVESLIEYSPEEAAEDALAYWLLRLIDDRDIDLYQLQIDLLSEQIAGYYNPETDELVVVTQTGDLNAIDKLTMAHEIVHALQDQHFDLIEMDSFATDSDRNLAITSLVEGDATFAMGAYMLEYLEPFELLEVLGESFAGPQEYDVLENAPSYIADQLVFPYEGGQEFVSAIYDTGGFEAVNASHEDPPMSSEQVLHPEKYLDSERDEPVTVENPDLQDVLGDEWQALFGDVLGEWDLRFMLEENGVAFGEAATAAAGWGGSWYDVYQSGDDGLVLLTTRWDSDEDAAEFRDALEQTLAAAQDEGGLRSDGERFFWTQASGDTVVFVSGTDRGTVEAAVQAVG